jgi:hypothetical protein
MTGAMELWANLGHQVSDQAAAMFRIATTCWLRRSAAHDHLVTFIRTRLVVVAGTDFLTLEVLMLFIRLGSCRLEMGGFTVQPKKH